MKKLLLLLTLPNLAWAQFTDVPTTHPHQRAISYVYEVGVVQGYSDQSYKPDQSINRVEFLKILLEAQLPNISNCETNYTYTDVDWGSWYGDYVQKASCENIVSGYPDGSFKPGYEITYAEAAKIINGVYGFGDTAGEVWYTHYIDRLNTENARPRQDIEAGDALTRGEMAEIIYRLSSQEASSQTPNILLIIADDMGFDATPWTSDIGQRKPDTPFLNELAVQSLTFKNTWSNPVCSPTRAGILTGKYGVHTGVLGPVSRNDGGIQLDEYTLQKHLSTHTDYAQAVIGKWHLSTSQNGSQDNPALMGIPYYSGMISGGVETYSDWTKFTNGQSQNSTDYITSVFTDDAISWVDAQTQPWFLWLAYTAPHTPFHDPPEHLINTTLDGSATGQYLAAIEAMDTEIGRLLESLPDEERDNTVIIFMGDNGTPGQVIQSPYSRSKAKGSLFNGGINIPFMVSGPGIQSGTEDALVNTTDLFATIAELAGAPVNNHENSVSFVPLLNQQGIHDRDYLYSEVSTTSKNTGQASAKNGWAIRDERYKYIILDNGSAYLFDLENDPFESNNLINDSALQVELERLKEEGEAIRNP